MKKKETFAGAAKEASAAKAIAESISRRPDSTKQSRPQQNMAVSITKSVRCSMLAAAQTNTASSKHRHQTFKRKATRQRPAAAA